MRRLAIALAILAAPFAADPLPVPPVGVYGPVR